MGVVAVYSARLSREVGAQLDFVIDHYLPGYAAIGEADVRTVEQALALRRLVITLLETPDDRAAIETHHASFMTKGRETEVDLTRARAHIAVELRDRSGRFSDTVSLARLDARLELMMEDRRRLEGHAADILAALGRRDHAELHRRMRLVDALRDDFDRKLDLARVEMLTLATNAAAETRRRQEYVILVSTIVMATAGALGLVVAAAVTLGLVRPVRRLLAGTKAVEAGALDTVVAVTSRDEIGTLTQSFNAMVGELKVKQRIRDTFGKYVDPRIVASLIENPAVMGNGGERRAMTVLFCDMKGFTTLSEGLTPTSLVNVINHYLTTMSTAIRAQNGIIDKYIGDGIMAFWGPPFITDEDHATLACLAALDQVARLDAFRAELPEVLGVKRHLPEVNIRVGIATGDVVVGNIGSDVLKSYTVMGDPVNVASRLEGASKAYGTRILASEATAARTAGAIEVREIDAILVVGKTEPERIFEVLGRKGDVDATRLAVRGRFAAGLAAYRRQAWPDAEAAFTAALELAPDDGPSRVFLARVSELRASPPAANWNGVWALTSK